MSRSMLLVLAVLALAFAAITGLAVRKGILGPEASAAKIGGPFHLVDQTGGRVSEAILDGKWSAVFFGFTYCPEACPTTLFALAQTERLLGSRAAKFQTVFISVDPGRDDPKTIAAYLANAAYPRAVHGLTGTPPQVAQAAKVYGVYYQKAGEGPGYQVNHSTITYLMSPRGRFVCAIPYGTPPDVMARKISAAMQQGSRAKSC